PAKQRGYHGFSVGRPGRWTRYPFARPWSGSADGFGLSQRHHCSLGGGRLAHRAFRVRLYGQPPPRAESLKPEYLAAVDALSASGPLIIGGKSMGGRVASMIADDLYSKNRIAGLLCLGYPFHPPGKPAQLRTTHLVDLKTPSLICQGTRDEFGTREEVAAYDLSDR